MSSSYWLLLAMLLHVQVRAFSWKSSSVECVGESFFHVACVFHNVVIYKGMLFYVLEGDIPDIPDARVTEWAGFPWDPSETKESKKLPMLSEFVNFISPSDLTAKVSKSAIVEKFSYAQFIKPQWQTLSAWWHSVDDAMSWFFRWCWHLGVCEYSKAVAKKSALVWIYDGDHLQGHLKHLEDMKDGHLDLFHCYAKRIVRLWDKPNNPPLDPKEDYPDEEVYVFRKLVAGTGNATAHVFHAVELFQLEPPPQERMKDISFFRECAGLSAQPQLPPSKHPRVMLMNRPYHKGRSILNLDLIHNLMTTAYPHLNITYRLMEGLSFKQQAAAFHAADVVVLPHGAAAMNLHFLPKVACVVDISAGDQNGLQAKHQIKLLQKLPSPPYRVAQFPMFLPREKLEGSTYRLRDDQQVKEGKCEEKLDFVLYGFSDEWHNGWYSSFHPDVDEMMSVLGTAISKFQANYICETTNDCNANPRQDGEL